MPEQSVQTDTPNTSEEGWDLIDLGLETNEVQYFVQRQPTTTTVSPTRRKFINAVRKIKKLLILRRIWGRAGIWLQKSSSNTPDNRRVRAVISHVFTSWPSTVLSGTKIIFAHLKRERGVLVYK